MGAASVAATPIGDMFKGLAGEVPGDLPGNGAEPTHGVGIAGIMRRHEDARMRPEGVRRRERFLREDIEAGGEDLTTGQSRQEIRLDQMPAAPHIDERGTGLQSA